MKSTKVKTFCRLSDDEKEYIRQNAGKVYDSEIAAWIGCSEVTISIHRRSMGIPSKRHIWTHSQMDTIRDLWEQHESIRSIGKYFNVSSRDIASMMSIMRKRFGYVMEKRSNFKKQKQ